MAVLTVGLPVGASSSRPAPAGAGRSLPSARCLVGGEGHCQTGWGLGCAVTGAMFCGDTCHSQKGSLLFGGRPSHTVGRFL